MWRLGTAPRTRALNPRAPRGRPSLNALAAAFVVGLQAALPSTVPTLLRTALKLQAFPFNQMPGAGEYARGCAGSAPQAHSAGQGRLGGSGGGSTAALELEEGGVLASSCTGSQACACSTAPGSGSGWDGARGAATSSGAGSHGEESMPAASRCAAGQADARGTDAESAGGRSADGALAASGCPGSHAYAHGAAHGSSDVRQGKRTPSANGCASRQAQSAAPGAGSMCGSDSPGAALGLCAICAAPLSESEALGAHERSLAGHGPGAGSRSVGAGLGCSAPGMHPARCGSLGAGAAPASGAGADGDAAALWARGNVSSACCYACRQLILAAPRGAPGAAGPGAGAGRSAVASLLPPLLCGTARAAGCLRLPPVGAPSPAGCMAGGQALRAQIAEYLLNGA